MLYLYESQRLEFLADLFIARFSSWAREGLLDPLRPEVVVPQNPVIGRWLAVRMSEEIGIFSDVSFPLAGRLIRDLLEPAFGDVRHPVHFEKSALVLRIYDLLPSLSTHPAFEKVRGFLGRDSSEFRRYELSVLVADLYDRSMIYRPDLLLSWEEGQGGAFWPAILWQRLAGQGRPLHRARLMERYVHHGGEKLRGDLPPRMTLFGLTGIPPRDLLFFRSLGEGGLCDLHLFFLNPCEEYWGDIVSVRARERAPEERASYLSTGSPLLASWGEQFRVIHQALSDLPQSVRVFPEASGTLLARIQEDIRTLVDRGSLVRQGRLRRLPIPASDRSIEVVRCPSPVREIEMLKDRILGLFAEIPDLTPEDVVVLAPDIGRYEGIIRSVFGFAGREEGEKGGRDPEIPFVISDRRELLEDPLFGALLSLLRIREGPLTGPFVFRLLSVPEIARRFGVGQVRPARLQDILEASGFRWGGHGGDRPPPYSGRREHTLEEAVDRLLLGYACGEEFLPPAPDRPDPLVLSDDLEGDVAGGLSELLEALDALSDTLSVPGPAGRWPERVSRILDDFFDLDPSDGVGAALRAIPDQLGREFSEASFEGLLTGPVLAHHLERSAKGGEGRDRFFSGGVTFGRMVPLRSIPFRAVCLIGMNDADFPRSSWPPSFDWLAADPQPGDRSLREDDRTLFLEAMLSARDGLWISFTGVDPRDGSPREPSVLVRQLMDLLTEGFEGESRPISEQIWVDAPIDPLSLSHYSEEKDPRLRSYSRSWHSALAALRSVPARERVFFDPDLSFRRAEVVGVSGDENRIPVDLLRSFARDPVRHFLTRRMGFPRSEWISRLREEEPFVIGEDLLLTRILQTSAPDRAELPWPPLRECIERRAFWEIAEYRRAVSSRADILFPEDLKERPRAVLDVRFRNRWIQGPIEGLYPTKSGGRRLLVERWPGEAWPSHYLETYLLHLLGCLFVTGYEGCVLTVRGDKEKAGGPERVPLGLIRWNPPAPSDASRELLCFLRAYRLGETSPLPFDPEASRAYVVALKESGGAGIALSGTLRSRAEERARRILLGPQSSSPRKNDQPMDPRIKSAFWNWLAFKGRDIASERTFALWSERLWGPIQKRGMEEGVG